MNSLNTTYAQFVRRGLADGSNARPLRSPSFRISDIWKAPLHDLPIRDEILCQYLPLTASMKVMEVGPGSGFTAFRLSRHVRQISLVDVSFHNATRLRRALEPIPNLRFFCADVSKPGLAEITGTRFDAIYGLEMFEYVNDPSMCLKNFALGLRPGGTLLLEFPNYPPEKSPGITFFRQRKELDAMLRAAGFQSWEIHALRLRPWARLLFDLLHEQPMQAYRRIRERGQSWKPLTYDQTWAFQKKSHWALTRTCVHMLWSTLSATMRLGGDCFERIPLGEDILNNDLLLVARK
jgi:SAM-dependent methyltransferase